MNEAHLLAERNNANTELLIAWQEITELRRQVAVRDAAIAALKADIAAIYAAQNG